MILRPRLFLCHGFYGITAASSLHLRREVILVNSAPADRKEVILAYGLYSYRCRLHGIGVILLLEPHYDGNFSTQVSDRYILAIQHSISHSLWVSLISHPTIFLATV